MQTTKHTGGNRLAELLGLIGTVHNHGVQEARAAKLELRLVGALVDLDLEL